MSQRILFCAFSVALAASGCSGSSESEADPAQGGNVPVGGRNANAPGVAGSPLRSGGNANALSSAGSPSSIGAGANALGRAGAPIAGSPANGLAGAGLLSSGGSNALGGAGANAGRGPDVPNGAGKSPIGTTVTGGTTGGRQSGGATSAGQSNSGSSSLASGGRGAGGKTSSVATSGNTAQSGAASGGKSATTSPPVGGKSGSSGAAGSSNSTNTGGAAGNHATVALPEENAPFDYQIGGNYTPPTGVRVVSRDRNSAPAAGLYNICYVNGFQIQPDEESFWNSQHPSLILKDGAGNPVVDEDWGEILLDTSTATKRSELSSVIGGWIAKCNTDGYNAVEIDNLDSYSRSNGLLTEANNVAFMALLSAAAHGQGLAIAQKNSSELLGSAAAMGTDFAVVEECNRYDECDQYQAVYGNRIFIIEYRTQDFQKGCTAYPELSIVLRDRNVSTPGSSGYVYQGC